MSLSNLVFQKVDDNLVIAGSLEMVNSVPKSTLDLTNTDTSKVYVFSSAHFHSNLQKIVGQYPNNKREVEIFDYDGKRATYMPNSRSTNRCGTINITISKPHISLITIPESKDDPESEYYIDMITYSQFEACNSTNVKKSLIKKDFFSFANSHSNLQLNFILNKNVFDFIKNNFTHDDIPENINIIPVNSYENGVRTLCEEIFGIMTNEHTAINQGELFFRLNSEILQPKFILGASQNISFSMRSNSIHFTGSGSSDFVAIVNAPVAISELKITTENESVIVYEGPCDNTIDFTDRHISKLIQLVNIYQELVESNRGNIKNRIKKFVMEKSDKIWSSVFENVEFEHDSRDVYELIIQRGLIALSSKFKSILVSIITHDYSQIDIITKKRSVEHAWGAGPRILPQEHIPFGYADCGLRTASCMPSLSFQQSIVSSNMEE